MTVLPAARRHPLVGTTSSASLVWRGFRRGFAAMGALGLGRPPLRRPVRSDAEALAGDWHRVLSGLDRPLQRARRDGRR